MLFVYFLLKITDCKMNNRHEEGEFLCDGLLACTHLKIILFFFQIHRCRLGTGYEIQPFKQIYGNSKCKVKNLQVYLSTMSTI